jgi:ABC-type sugar transport system ATPase subunit
MRLRDPRYDSAPPVSSLRAQKLRLSDRCDRTEFWATPRVGVCVCAKAQAAAFARRVIIMDEPTAALGVKESRRALELILDVKRRGLPIILISHNMPHVFEVADRIHIHRLGRRLAVIDPRKQTMSEAVAMMTGALAPPAEQAA